MANERHFGNRRWQDVRTCPAKSLTKISHVIHMLNNNSVSETFFQYKHIIA